MASEKPIIFSTESVRAILDGKKTMTRRVIKPQPLHYLPEYDRGGYFMLAYPTNYSSDTPYLVKCPYGQVGDRLWVRETWTAPLGYDFLSPSGLWDKPKIWYYADGEPPKNFGIKRSSIFMPRWASRITLEITDVRVERLQEITAKDAIAEGIGFGIVKKSALTKIEQGEHLRGKFSYLWDSLNAKYGWETNPWVWVIEFKEENNASDS